VFVGAGTSVDIGASVGVAVVGALVADDVTDGVGSSAV
jgi:hypothetical protein